MSRTIHRIVVTERDLREQVRDICKLFGWRMYFSWTSIHSPRGFPDLVLVNPEKQRLIFAELKSAKGELSEHQVEWIEALRQAGQVVFVWKPHQIEEIVEILRA